MAKIVCFDTKSYDIETFNAANSAFGFDITYIHDRLTAGTVALAQGADAVCLFVHDAVDSELARQLAASGVSHIALRSAGYNHIDLKSVYDHKIHVTRVPAYSPYAVAEHAAALLLTLIRKTHKAYNRTRESNFNITGLTGFDLHGKTAGVIGAGKIGRIMIRILRGFGMNVLVADHYHDSVFEDETGCRFTSVEEIYSTSDIISLHCPLTPDTHHMISREAIHSMKKGVIIINTSRGMLIDTLALIEGLKEGQIGGAGLDVYEEENEYFFHDFSMTHIDDDQLARLLSFNNVLITSHQAFLTQEALQNIAETTLQNIADFLEEKPLKNEICYRCGGDCKKELQGRCF